MVLHVVLLRVKPGVEADAVERLRVAILGLRLAILGIVAVRWGRNESPEDLHRGYELGFVMTFESAMARDAYLPHPAHTAVHPLVGAVAATTIIKPAGWSEMARYGILFGHSMGMSGFDRVVGSRVACRGARGLVKTGNKELRIALFLSLPKSQTSR